ncbi:MAG TPA: single-stranded-DNA-specific exonuclease RecJ [Gammaproteobacteria bacterium]|nr:single-stranded-DNA-specific exonuclease RecJ [Gammaproteobacteria bacterium]
MPPVLRRVYTARGIADPAELEYRLENLHHMRSLGGLDAAVDLLAAAVTEGQRVLIVGDFDADGATSSTVALRALRAMGLERVGYLVPNRFEYGYGLSPEIVEVAARESPDVIVTVDNGVSSVAGVVSARQHGIRVLVTDHHLPGETLPAADAMVNPNLRGDPFPSKHLAGVGVIFYVMLALRARLQRDGWLDGRRREVPNMADLLDLVALGTVADVVPLDRNNRVLVSQGLRRIRAGRACPGLLALLQAGGRDPARAVSADLAFAAGPRLNAAGRLEDMSLGIECLCSDDPARATDLAARLDGLNRERREIEGRMQQEAHAYLDGMRLDDSRLPVGLCLYDPAWHQGVVGILASRVKERVQRPVIAFARSRDGELKGSARSVPGMHMRDAIGAVATRHPELVGRFGGHAMAAGLSLAEAHYERFARAFDEEARRRLDDNILERVIHSDGELSGAELTLETARVLRDAGPWGQGFPEPVFDGEFEVLERRVVGERHLKLTLGAGNGTLRLDAIAFNHGETWLPEERSRVRAAYRLDVNAFRARERLQLIVEHLEPV